MEIKYMRTYAPKGKKYSLGDVPFALGHAMEITELRPNLAEGRLNPGEMLMLLFVITPEEYALKDSDPKALDALADQLLKTMPSDRLLAWIVRDLKGTTVQSAVKPRLGESIDGGALVARVREKQRKALEGPLDAQLTECRRLQLICRGKDVPEGVKADWQAARAALARSLSELDTIFAAFDNQLGNRWPAVGFDGRVEIFTTKIRAEAAMAQVHKANAGVQIWTLKEIKGADVAIFFKKLENDGLLELRVDNGFASAELSLMDFGALRREENAQLRCMVLREIAYGMRFNAFKQANAPDKNKIGALESMLSLRNFVWHTAGKAVLYAACDIPSDGGRLCTAAALARLPDQTGFIAVGGERCLTLKNKQTEQTMLAVFTTSVQAVAFCERIGSGARPVAMTFDDLILRANPCGGMIIDPDGLSYRIMKADFDKVKDARTKPVSIVRIKPDAETPAEPAPQPKAKSEDDLGVLPDPDAAGIPETLPEKPAEPAETAPAEDKPQPKGLFRRLFGKD